MRFNEYQKLAISFRARDLTDRESKLTMALGMCSEAGEAADIIKKHIGHGHDIDKKALTKELGDVMWYIAAVADEFNISMNDIALGNIKKLKHRYKDGKFSSEASKNREEYNVKQQIKDKEMMRGPLKYKAYIKPDKFK